MPPAPRPDYRQHLVVETPEHVRLDYELAGIGSRTLAALIDGAIIGGILLAITLLAGAVVSVGGGWGLALLIVLYYGTMLGYFALFEGLRDGQTPGKRATGTRVVRDTGHAVTVVEAGARGLLLPIDAALTGVALIMMHPRAKRLGDLVAGTVVVRDRPVVIEAPPSAIADVPGEEAGSPLLDDDAFRILREFHQRAPSLPDAARERLAGALVRRFADALPPTPGSAFERLAALHHDETARRRGRFGAKTAGRRSPVERLVARKGDRWDAFRVQAERVSARGLDDLAAAELPDFAARYREVAADLARAHTYRADGHTILRLERLVAAGHNALYRRERRGWREAAAFLFRECPAELLAARWTIALAALVFVGAGAAGFALLRERPALAESLVPDGMLVRAEAGAERERAGEGYYTADRKDRPVMAAMITGNNIRVAFTAFAGGALLGVGALLVLAFNGLSLGTITGHFANLGLAGYLWTFVAGHGVLELFAITVAGAAGLRLGLAVVAPGRRTRTDAFSDAGRRAMRMMAAVVLLLIVAGAIEGLISAGEATVGTRIAVAAGSVVLLAAYLVAGKGEPRAESRGRAA